MTQDPFAELKVHQRAMWASFSPVAMFTTVVAAHLVKFAAVVEGEKVLDVGTGTGVVAITAAQIGARVTGLDLTPALLDHARENAHIARVGDMVWTEGDAEQLPYADASFDVVLSQFGHIFAPRPAVAVAEMRRVLKPGGRIAFATWPPEHFIGSMFTFIARRSPPPPGVSPPSQWGSPATIAERLEGRFTTPFFERGTLKTPSLSVAHFRHFMEQFAGPMEALVARMQSDPAALATMRGEFEALAQPYFSNNVIHQSYLLTRAKAA